MQAGKMIGGKAAFCEVVAAGHASPIRNMDQEAAEKALLALLPQLSGLFGGRVQIERTILAGCIKIVLKKFNHLGLNELYQAYEMYYAGELAATGAEMYAGIFNAGNMTKILAAYSDYRRQLIGKYHQILEAEQTKTKEAEKVRKHKQFLQTIPAEIKAKRLDIQSWRDIPIYWFEAGIELRLFERPVDSPSIRQLQKEARNAARQEVDQEAQQDREQAGTRRKIWVAAMRDLEAKVQQREVVIFMKMYVYQKLFNHKIQY